MSVARAAAMPAFLPVPLPPHGPHGVPVTRLVVHCMAEQIRNTDASVGPVGTIAAHAWLAALGLSAHALIRPDGVIIECVPRGQLAYHAKGYNTGSLGVELLVAGAHDYAGLARAVGWNVTSWKPASVLPVDPYTAAQYASLGWWLAREAHALGLGWSAVTSHDRLSPDRKFDPGPVFSWSQAGAAFSAAGSLVL